MLSPAPASPGISPDCAAAARSAFEKSRRKREQKRSQIGNFRSAAQYRARIRLSSLSPDWIQPRQQAGCDGSRIIAERKPRNKPKIESRFPQQKAKSAGAVIDSVPGHIEAIPSFSEQACLNGTNIGHLEDQGPGRLEQIRRIPETLCRIREMFQDMKHRDEVKSAVLPDPAADGSMTHRDIRTVCSQPRPPGRKYPNREGQSPASRRDAKTFRFRSRCRAEAFHPPHSCGRSTLENAHGPSGQIRDTQSRGGAKGARPRVRSGDSRTTSIAADKTHSKSNGPASGAGKCSRIPRTGTGRKNRARVQKGGHIPGPRQRIPSHGIWDRRWSRG